MIAYPLTPCPSGLPRKPSNENGSADRPAPGGGKIARLAPLIAGAALLIGCRATTSHTHISPAASQLAPQSTVVVVPFENLSNNRNAGLAVTDLASSILFAHDYLAVLEVGALQDNPDTRFRRLETSPWDRQLGANPVAAAAVGRASKADCVLTGSVGEYGFVDGFGETATVGITVRLVRSDTAEVLWAGSLSRRVGSVAFSEESAHRLAHQVLSDLLGTMIQDLRAVSE